MASSSNDKIKWHFDILPGETKTALDFLSREKWLEKTEWYLAGGTALALHAGHRRSIDLDFFIKDSYFNNNELVERLTASRNFKTELNKDRTVYAQLFGAKISFIAYPFFVPANNFGEYGAVKILSPFDISVMKIVAISQRGRKRDFFDLYWCTKNLQSLEEIVKKLPTQYPSVAHDYHHILKSLVYFADAESDPEPVVFFKADWKEVKTFFEKEVPIITKRLLNLE